MKLMFNEQLQTVSVLNCRNSVAVVGGSNTMPTTGNADKIQVASLKILQENN